MPDPDNANRKPVTTRDVAARAGVSNATVSLALRHHSRISAATRDKVFRAAEELGYRPDPQISKLMHHLRHHRAPGFQSTIAALTTVPETSELSYLRDIHLSAKVRAEKLGYAFMVMRLPGNENPKPAVERILSSRGIEGILLLPMLSPTNIEKWFQWSQFAVVATTYSVTAPEFHRVVPHQFGNALRLCRELVDLGYKRIGLVQSRRQDLAVHRGFSAAVAWQSTLGGTGMVRPLIHAGAKPRGLKAWFKKERPDVIVASGEDDCRQIAGQLDLPIPGPIGFTVLNRVESGELAGIHELPAEIGSAAVEMLHTKIINGTHGIPDVPIISMVSGQWVTGSSIRQAQAVTRAG